MTPAYDLISTVVHTPNESDTALDLYKEDMESDYYLAYGYYGCVNFIELARRLGIIEKRAERIINSFLGKEKVITRFVENSFLSAGVKKLYIAHIVNKLKRLEPQVTTPKP